MPRKARIDAPWALHHVITRGIERRKIFRSDDDRANFVQRLAELLPETNTDCFAWALLDNHAHMLLRTGSVAGSVFMNRLLTGYAGWFNRKYRRHGQLFQNRYQSILCQEDPYLKELVRYIHLNPMRAGLVADMGELEAYPWCGHGVLMNKSVKPWQNIDDVLGLFSDRVTACGKSPQTVEARALLCFWAHRKLGMSTIAVARRLKISQPAASRLSKRGERIEKENRFDLIEDGGFKT
jgi:REP element-mobilizing transposase RayT